MSVINQNLLLTPEGYQISRSVRLRSSASAYFNRTPAAASNRKTWTWSGWLKRGALGVRQGFFSCQNGAGNASLQFGFLDNDCFQMGNGNVYLLQSTALYRDPSAYYHCIVSVDTTLASNRSKVYINGNQITTWATNVFDSNVAQNTDLAINNNLVHYLGQIGANLSYFDGYLTEVNFIDGQALTPSSFGETDSITGVWKPKKYAGTYGTNGFYLNFSDNSAATAATIGKDSSGNGNNWTPNNVSVTAGVTYDSMLDVPTMWADGGNGRGNYCTWNPTGGTTSSTYSNANLTVSRSAGSTATVISTMAMQSGAKYYFEMSPASVSGAYPVMGIQNIAINTGANANPSPAYQANGVITVNGTDTSGFSTFTSNDIIGVAFDPSTGKCWFSKNGTWQNGDPVAGTITTPTVSTSIEWCPAVGTYSAVGAITLNCGQRPFAYTPPTGFKALNTQNLPDATIKNGLSVFDATTWTGTGASLSVNVSGKFQPDLVWIKGRSGATGHRLTDSTRGATLALSSDSPVSNTITDTQGVTAFNSGGFTVGSNSNYNTNAATYIGWQWKKGASQGFDISAVFTGTGAAQTVNHSLGVAPSMIILFSTGGTNWINTRVYHKNLTAGYALQLSTTAAQFSEPTAFASISSSSFQTTQTSGQTNIAYLFAEVAGFSKFGSVSMNGSADGAFVFTGFLPKLVMLKRTDSTSNWIMWDTVRNTYNVVGEELYPNLSSAASTVTDLDILSNGFKMRNSGFSGTWIYAAWSQSPFKNSLAR